MKKSGSWLRTIMSKVFDRVVLTGMVVLYELCFEQSWKMMKEILESHGYEEGATGSSKTILKTAYKAAYG